MKSISYSQSINRLYPMQLETIFSAIFGTFITAMGLYLGKILLTPNEKVTQLNAIITQHTKLISDLSNEIREVISENAMLKKRVEDLEQENHALKIELNRLKQ